MKRYDESRDGAPRPRSFRFCFSMRLCNPLTFPSRSREEWATTREPSPLSDTAHILLRYTSGVNPIVLLLYFLIAVPAWAQAKADDSMYSRSATSIWASGDVTIPAPDGKKAIVVKHPENPASEETHTVLIRVGSHVYRTKIGALVNAEAAWAPDSKAFFVTYSDAGGIGTYHVRVVYVSDAGIHAIEPVPNGRRLFKPTCFDPEMPNVGAIGWIGNGSDRLAIAGVVPPHSSCASMGTFKAFVIHLPDRKVVSEYGQIEAKSSFSKLIGSELRYAEDSCIENPQSCIPCGMKGGKCGPSGVPDSHRR